MRAIKIGDVYLHRYMTLGKSNYFHYIEVTSISKKKIVCSGYGLATLGGIIRKPKEFFRMIEIGDLEYCPLLSKTQD